MAIWQNGKTGQDEKFYRASKLDVFVIGGILFLSFACIFWIARSRFQQSLDPQPAFIYQQGKLLEQVDLKKDRIISILGGRIQAEVKQGKIRIADADCPKHLCMNMGWIRHSGQTIVCVPNKIVIEIKSAGVPLLDAVVN